MADAPVSRQRIDKWLFFTRLAKSRTLAQEWIAAGHVSVNDEKVRRSSAEVKTGDRLEILVERRTIILIMRGPGERRGPYEEARLLYEDISPPQEKLTLYDQVTREPGAGRPEKKERRELDRLRDRNSFGSD